MDEYEIYEKQIDQALAKYRKSSKILRQIEKEISIRRSIMNSIQNFASEEKYQWHRQQKKLLNELKREKDDIANKNVVSSPANVRRSLLDKPPQENAGMEYARLLEQEIKKELDRVQAGTEKAVEISTYIKLELNRQIEVLDNVYEQNRDIENRLKRVKKGLIVILRRAMMNKCTRFLVVLLVLAVIGLVVVWILRNNGVLS